MSSVLPFSTFFHFLNFFKLFSIFFSLFFHCFSSFFVFFFVFFFSNFCFFETFFFFFLFLCCVKVVQKIAIDHTTRACIPSQPRGRTGDNCQHPSKAFAALQERMFLHLRSQAPRTRSRRISGAVEALNAANSTRKLATSLDHLPHRETDLNDS